MGATTELLNRIRTSLIARRMADSLNGLARIPKLGKAFNANTHIFTSPTGLCVLCLASSTSPGSILKVAAMTLAITTVEVDSGAWEGDRIMLRAQEDGIVECRL